MGMRRICKSCKLEWNVSRIEPGGKHYICPTCALREALKAKAGKQQEAVCSEDRSNRR